MVGLDLDIVSAQYVNSFVSITYQNSAVSCSMRKLVETRTPHLHSRLFLDSLDMVIPDFYSATVESLLRLDLNIISANARFECQDSIHGVFCLNLNIAVAIKRNERQDSTFGVVCLNLNIVTAIARNEFQDQVFHPRSNCEYRKRNRLELKDQFCGLCCRSGKQY